MGFRSDIQVFKESLARLKKMGSNKVSGEEIEIIILDEVPTIRKPIAAFDLDGTLAQYNGYKGEYKIGPPVTGMIELFKKLQEEGWSCGIYSCRNDNEVAWWCNKWNLEPDWINQNKFLDMDCPNKPFANIYIDDKAICFKGNAVELEYQIQKFKEWWKDE